MKLLNWDLIRQPYNWLIVGVVLGFWLLLLNVVMPEANREG